MRAVELAAKKSGLDKVGAHTKRHSEAVAWLESGVHIKAAADLLGHSSISVTGDPYGHTSDDTARAAIDGLGTVLGLCAGLGMPFKYEQEKGTFSERESAFDLCRADRI
nr:tyrosine-type recombinase/integrase [Mycolicibacterium hippocampi]